jgi:predicted RNA-binding protein with PIN domain
LVERLEQARAEAASLLAEREASEWARHAAEEERARAQEAMVALQSRLASLGVDLDTGGEQESEVRRQRELIAQLTDELQEADAEAARLEADREQARAAAGRGIARAAEAARLLGETLAELASPVADRAPAYSEWAVTGEEEVPRRASGVGGTWRPQQVVRELGSVGGLVFDSEVTPEKPPAARAGGDEPPAAGERRPGVEQADEPDPRPRMTPEVLMPSPPRPRPGTPRRRSVPLPRAMFDDSIEAANHLVRVPGIVLVVDGYSVTISTFGDLELSHQRRQLVDRLGALTTATGTQVRVVFDWAELSERFGPPADARSQMRVTFSSDGGEPEQVILDLVDQLETAQAVVVATDDRRLQQAARGRGGNVISVSQLLAALEQFTGSPAEAGPIARIRRRRKQAAS